VIIGVNQSQKIDIFDFHMVDAQGEIVLTSKAIGENVPFYIAESTLLSF
jgi:hypothetical protein